jgi:hypothetical protein
MRQFIRGAEGVQSREVARMKQKGGAIEESVPFLAGYLAQFG